MANTITKGNGAISITSIDSDWDFKDSFPEQEVSGIKVDTISFSAGADGDKIAIKEGSATGPLIFPKQPMKVQGPPIIQTYKRRIRPFLDMSDSTIGGTLENLNIIFST